jgi:putative transposase
MQSLKGHTARQANKLLARTGTFWQEESYDHYVRNSEAHQRIVHYIRQNPVKAGLVSRSEE